MTLTEKPSQDIQIYTPPPKPCFVCKAEVDECFCIDATEEHSLLFNTFKEHGFPAGEYVLCYRCWLKPYFAMVTK